METISAYSSCYVLLDQNGQWSLYLMISMALTQGRGPYWQQQAHCKRRVLCLISTARSKPKTPKASVMGGVDSAVRRDLVVEAIFFFVICEQLYQPFVICDHREQRYQRGEGPERTRSYATIAKISCEHDLLLLQVARGRMMHYCIEPHNPVTFSNRSVKALRRVVMLTWPFCRDRTAVRGHISHRGRTMADISGDNPYGFTMRLAEVDITSESGSSGAPCFDGWGDGVGLLHGGDGRFSYFIPLNVVRQTLAQWGWGMYADE